MLQIRTLFGYALSTVLLAACSSQPQQQAPSAVPVNIYAVQEGSASYYDLYPGTVTALTQVEIRAQVSGYITSIDFQDGQHITKGQKLYSIDQQQYQANYDQSVANLNVANANEAKAQQDADRYQELAKNDAIATQTLDHAIADLQSAKMQVRAAKANVASVETNLRYATIYAPLTGTIGISQVKLGAVVSPGQTILNTVSADDPMAVDINIDEKLIPRFVQLQNTPNDKDSTFQIVLPDQSVYPYYGHISLIDRSVDPQTGTIKARLVFSNPQNMLRDGMNCNVRVQNTGNGQQLLIPYKAVVEQLGEYFVYVVNDSNKAIQHKVSLGTKINDKVVVNSGIQQGDKVVVEGVQKLRDSSAVQIGAPKK